MDPLNSRPIFNANGTKVGYVDRCGVFRDIEGRGLGMKLDIFSDRIVTDNHTSTGLRVGSDGRIKSSW